MQHIGSWFTLEFMPSVWFTRQDMKFAVITPFSRPQHLVTMLETITNAGGGEWFPVVHEGHAFPDLDWVQPIHCPIPEHVDPCYFKINTAIESVALQADTYYGFLCDDDTYDAHVFEGMRNATTPIVVISARRFGGSPAVGGGVLHASPMNMHPCLVGLEQVFIRGDVLHRYRFGNHGCADGELFERLAKEQGVTYFPDLFVNWNVLSP